MIEKIEGRVLGSEALHESSKKGGLRLGRLVSLIIGVIILDWLLGNGALSGLLSSQISLDNLWARFNTLTTIFLGIFIEAAAFLLLGVLMSAIIQVFVTPDMLYRWVPQNRFGATIMGAFMGMVFPVCECGSVPAARRLMSKGAPVSLGVAFLLAAPVINPVVIASTWVAFGGDPWIVGGRIGLTILIAAVIAVIFSLHPAPLSFLTPATAEAALACAVPDKATRGEVAGEGGSRPLAPLSRASRAPSRPLAEGGGERWRSRLHAIATHSSSEFFEMGQYVVLGAFLAALAQTVVPQDVLLAIGSTPVTSVIVMMTLAVVLSICSTVDAFVALGFANTFGTGSILAFLVYGPMIDIKAVLLFTTTFKRHAVSLIVVLVTLMSFLAAIWVNLNVG